MKIIIKTANDESTTLEVEELDTIENIKLKIKENKSIPLEKQILIYEGQLLEDNKTLAYYNNISEESVLILIVKKKIEIYVESIKDDMIKFFEETKKLDSNKTQISENDPIGFIKKNLKRNELYINLIYFDKNIGYQENYIYFNQFKIDVVGGFYTIDDLIMLQNYLESIKDKNIPFVVISTGSSGKDVIHICQKYSFVREVIIFCKNYNYNEHYIKEYPGYVKKVLTNIKNVYDYLKTFMEEYKDEIEKYFNKNKFILSSNCKQIYNCPFISSFEYDKCFFLVHKIYSQFFGDINNKNEESMFKRENLNKIINFLTKLDYEEEEEGNIMIQKFKNFVDFSNNNDFIEKSIKEYTNESNFCSLFNKEIRNFEKGVTSFAYYIGPLLYGLNKYVKDNPKFAFHKNMELNKIIICPKMDYNKFKLNNGHIICLTSLTSTSSDSIKYDIKNLLHKSDGSMNENVLIKIKFIYKHKSGNISPGIVLENNKLKDGNYISCNPKEKEVILFPFTFVKLKDINAKIKNGIEIFEIKSEIINRNSYIEYLLRSDIENRIKFSDLE